MRQKSAENVIVLKLLNICSSIKTVSVSTDTVIVGLDHDTTAEKQMFSKRQSSVSRI